MVAMVTVVFCTSQYLRECLCCVIKEGLSQQLLVCCLVFLLVLSLLYFVYWVLFNCPMHSHFCIAVMVILYCGLWKYMPLK